MRAHRRSRAELSPERIGERRPTRSEEITRSCVPEVELFSYLLTNEEGRFASVLQRAAPSTAEHPARFIRKVACVMVGRFDENRSQLIVLTLTVDDVFLASNDLSPQVGVQSQSLRVQSKALAVQRTLGGDRQVT